MRKYKSWKEYVVAYFAVIADNLRKDTEGKNKRPPDIRQAGRD